MKSAVVYLSGTKKKVLARLGACFDTPRGAAAHSPPARREMNSLERASHGRRVEKNPTRMVRRQTRVLSGSSRRVITARGGTLRAARRKLGKVLSAGAGGLAGVAALPSAVDCACIARRKLRSEARRSAGPGRRQWRGQVHAPAHSDHLASPHQGARRSLGLRCGAGARQSAPPFGLSHRR